MIHGQNEQRTRLRQARERLEKARVDRDDAIRAAALAGLSHREIGREIRLSGVQVGRIVDRDSPIPRDRRATWVAHPLTVAPTLMPEVGALTQSLFLIGVEYALSQRL